MIRLLKTLGALCLTGTLLAPCALAARVAVPGTLVTLEPPPGFTPMANFPGFEYPAKRATIVVSELPGSVSEVRRGLTRENLASRGMTLIGSQMVRVGGQSALLLQLSKQVAGLEIIKWMLVAGDEKKSVMVVGSFPKPASDLSLPIKQAVLSASWTQPGPGASFEGLTFRVRPSPLLKLAGRVGNMVLFSESGRQQPSDTTEAMLIMGSAFAPSRIGDVEAFARARAGQTLRIGPLRDVQGRALALNGLPGYEMVARTTDSKSGQELRMYQLVLAEGSTYYLAQGFVTPERAAAMVPQFKLVTGSFRRVKPTN